MGNMLPCLVQGSSSSILPPMNTKHWSRSMKILARTLRRSTKLPHGSNRVKAAAGSTETSSAAYQSIPRARRAPRIGAARTGGARPSESRFVLTRPEAARLLSLTAHGHRTAAQVVGELKRMQAAATGNSRASTAQVISELKRMEELVVARASTSPSASTAWRPVLESIPEEWQ